MSTLPPSWKTIFDLVAQWQGPLTTDEGVPAAELDALEAELGKPLPTLVRAWYEKLGKCTRLYDSSSQLHLTPYTQLEVSSLWEDLDGENLAGSQPDYPRRLIIYDENQYLYSWVILESDFHLPNPPVYIEDADGVLGSDYLLIPSSAYFSDFAAQALAFELINGSENPLELDTPSPLADAARLLTPVAAEPLVHPQALRFWFTDGILAATMDDAWFCAEALSEEAQLRFQAQLVL